MWSLSARTPHILAFTILCETLNLALGSQLRQLAVANFRIGVCFMMTIRLLASRVSPSSADIEFEICFRLILAFARQSQHHGCQLPADVDIAKTVPNFFKHRYASNEPMILSSKHAFFERVFIHTNCGLSRYAFGNTAVDNPNWTGSKPGLHSM